MTNGEQGNAMSKMCAICEKVQIMRSADLCMACAQHAHEEAERDMLNIARWLEKQARFDAYCDEQGLPDPHEP